MGEMTKNKWKVWQEGAEKIIWTIGAVAVAAIIFDH